MSADARTLAAYAEMAGRYADQVAKVEPDADMRAFLDALPAQADILDWGCGVGNAAAMMVAEGHRVTATDACRAMADIAAELGIAVRLESFDALDVVAAHDGIWANFSLFHVARDDLPALLHRAATALRPGGLLHMGMACATPGLPLESRDALGVFLALWSQADLDAACAAAGLSRVAARTGLIMAMGQERRYLVARYRKDAPG